MFDSCSKADHRYCKKSVVCALSLMGQWSGQDQCSFNFKLKSTTLLSHCQYYCENTKLNNTAVKRSISCVILINHFIRRVSDIVYHVRLLKTIYLPQYYIPTKRKRSGSFLITSLCHYILNNNITQRILMRFSRVYRLIHKEGIHGVCCLMHDKMI